MLFAKLKGAIVAEGLPRYELAERLHLGTATLSVKLNGHRSFTLEEVYEIMDILHIPADQMHIYFPKGGK